MKKVYFDESGNTGGNLLDANDTIFSLASCHFTAEQEKTLLEHFKNFAGPELKFSRLRKSPAGQRMVSAFLEAPEISNQTVAVAAFHKPLMIVTKYCDLVLEPSMRKTGIDFYKRGLNIATFNLLHLTMPAYLSPVTWQGFLESFVRVVRERTSAAFTEFRLSAELIYSYLSNKEPRLASMISPVLLLRSDGSDLFSHLNEDELDPLIPAYHALVGNWGDVLGELYEMVADESKMLVKERERLLQLSRGDLRPVRAGYDQRQVQYPLKLSQVIAANSHTEKQVQLADVIAGAVRHLLKLSIATKKGLSRTS